MALVDDTENTPKLKKSQLNFVRNYIEQDFTNATRAYARAYPKASEETARKNASRMLTKADIQSAIAKELAAVLAEARVPLEKRILDVWVKRAFFDPTEIIGLDGNLVISIDDLRSRGLQVCIDSINEKMTSKGDRYIEYKLADRDKALDMLQKYIAMIKAPDQNINLRADRGLTLTLTGAKDLAPEELEEMPQ